MNQLTKMFDGHKLTIVEKNGEPKFLLKDVCNILGLGQVAGVKRRLDEDVITNHPLKTAGGVQQATFVNEDGLYDVILDSRKPEAKKFRKWITSEVIPSIRKTGSYEIEKPKTQLEILQGTINQLVEQEKRMAQLENQVNETKREISNISNIVTLTNIEWRDKVTTILRKIAQNWSGVEPYRSVINLSYERLERRAGCNLNIRVNNRKERAIAQGMSKSYVRKISKLDCIAEERRLVEIYLQVVKEMAIEFRVNVNDFKFEGVV